MKNNSLRLMKSHTVRASFWTIFGFGSSQILRLFSNLILTRMLMPEMFGLMSIVTVVRIGVYMCSEIGLKVNVIRHENGEDPELLNTAWTLQVIRGAILWIVISVIGLVIYWANVFQLIEPGTVYADDRLPLLLAVTGIVAFISGFESTSIWLAQRNMILGRLTTLELFSQIIGLAVMIGLAWLYHDVWALVVGSIISSILKTVLSHYVLQGKSNYFYWNKKIFIELFQFGKWLLLSAIITFFALNGDRLILGGLLSTEQLGFYTVAYFIATALKDVIDKLIFNVWFPLLSKVYRENRDKIVETYYELRNKQDKAIYFLVGFLYVIAPLIIDTLYDARYESAGWMLKILVISLIGSCYRLGNSLMLAMGNSKVGAISNAFRAIALWSTVPAGYYYYGAEGAIWAIAINPLLEIPIILVVLLNHKIISWYKEIRYLPFVGVGYGMGLGFLKFYNLML